MILASQKASLLARKNSEKDEAPVPDPMSVDGSQADSKSEPETSVAIEIKETHETETTKDQEATQHEVLEDLHDITALGDRPLYAGGIHVTALDLAPSAESPTTAATSAVASTQPVSPSPLRNVTNASTPTLSALPAHMQAKPKAKAPKPYPTTTRRR